MYLNINGLTSHKTELEWIISKMKPIIVCVTETHITENFEEHELFINGFNTINMPSVSRHTGGVIIYIKNEYKYKILLKMSIHMILWIVGIQVQLNRQKYNIFNLYHSPNASKANFLEKLEDILEEYASKPEELYIVGDFNIDMRSDSTNVFYRNKLINMVNSNGLYQVVNKPTRITKESCSIIDLIITSKKDAEFDVCYTPKITDHAMLTIEIQNNHIGYSYIRKTRNMDNFNELQYQLDLMKCQWTPDSTNTDLLSKQLVRTITDTLENHAPITEKLVNEQWGNKLWWNKTIDYQMKERDILYKRAMYTQESSDWKEYRQQRNRVVELVKSEKEKYYRQKIDEVKHDSKEMWKTLKRLIKGGKQNKKGIWFGDIFESNEKIIAEKFNEYFISSINSLVKKTNDLQLQCALSFINVKECTFEKFHSLELKELKEIIINMRNKNSSVDGVTTKLLKLSFEVIGNRFLQTINNSLEKGEFPESWKTSTVIPIEKIPNTTKAEEHRPINMVPCYEKLLELVVHKQICQYLEENNLLTVFQAGFRKQHSCESAIQSVIYEWKKAINDREKIVGVVFLDLKRAFETINRELLILKLEQYGFRNTVRNWFNSYLKNRTQETKYNNIESVQRGVQHGVPQGTVLGPTLFLLYINDIVNCIQKCKIQLFADDTLIYYIGNSVEEVVDVINRELVNIQKWLNNNSLILNVNKTHFMVVKNKYNFVNTFIHQGLFINNENIKQVSECKYLGIFIDDNLTFSQHALYITKKISKKVNLLSRISHNLSTWTRLVIYKSIIAPHFDYCSSILYLLNNSEINILQKKQNQALRIILMCNRYASIRSMLEVTSLMSIRQRIFYNTMMVIFKIKNKIYPQHLLNNLEFVNNIHSYNTRNKNNFYVQTVSTNYGQNNLFHKGLLDYNSLPQEIKNCSHLNLFKKLCRSYVLNYKDI